MTVHPRLRYSSSESSLGSNITSRYSGSGCDKGDYEITGKVELGLWYKEGQLVIQVVKAEGLAAAKQGRYSDPYIKTHLLPDESKKTKKKTDIKKRTTNPSYNAILEVLQQDLKHVYF